MPTPLTFAYPFELIRVLDGDTVEGYADLGFYISRRVTVRLNGINAPETHGDAEKSVGLLVKACVEKWFKVAAATPNQSLWLVSKEVDKYGRVLGEIELRPVLAFSPAPASLNAWLISIQLVQTYWGGTKRPYTPQELSVIEGIARTYLKGTP
jgi:endonuclease YncB( thermonuclease family)